MRICNRDGLLKMKSMFQYGPGVHLARDEKAGTARGRSPPYLVLTTSEKSSKIREDASDFHFLGSRG